MGIPSPHLRHLRLIIVWAGLLATTAAALAGCGGDDDHAPTAATTTTIATTTTVVVAALAAGASPATGSAAVAVSPSRAATRAGESSDTAAAGLTFQDPFAYCGAVLNALHPAAPYTGPAEPDAIVRALERASGAAAGSLDHFAEQQAVYWRCMKGGVYGCSPGANLQCWDADINETPTQAMQDWCTGKSDGPIPAVVTGHATIFEWNCTARGAARGRQLEQLDAAGLNSRIWYQLAP